MTATLKATVLTWRNSVEFVRKREVWREAVLDDRGLCDGRRVLLLRISRLFDPRWPDIAYSLGQLASIVGTTEISAKRAMAAGVAGGWIVRTRGGGMGNAYRLSMPEGGR